MTSLFRRTRYLRNIPVSIHTINVLSWLTQISSTEIMPFLRFHFDVMYILRPLYRFHSGNFPALVDVGFPYISILLVLKHSVFCRLKSNQVPQASLSALSTARRLESFRRGAITATPLRQSPKLIFNSSDETRIRLWSIKP